MLVDIQCYSVSTSQLVAFQNCSIGVPVQFHTDGNVFNLRRLLAKTKVQCQVIRELLFADDCALLAHTEKEAQELFNRFSDAARRFGLTVSLRRQKYCCNLPTVRTTPSRE